MFIKIFNYKGNNSFKFPETILKKVLSKQSLILNEIFL